MHPGARIIMKSIVLKFPKIAKHFQKIEKTLHEYDRDKNDVIDLNEITPFLNSLGVMCENEVEALFRSADRNNKGKLSFKEVLVCLALGYVLKLFHEKGDNSEGEHHLFHDLQGAFEVTTYAFLEFDKDGSGEIDKNEVASKFNNKGGVRKRKTRKKSLASERMSQLDVNADGTVTYKEFLHGFYSWVAVHMEDDEDEDPDSVGGGFD